MSTGYTYNRNVFINCPFDKEYTPLFDAILFTVYKCGFRPRCALEIDDGGQVRIEKINRIIEECRCGIHDISRTELDINNLPRFNMPFELGLFLGARRFGAKSQQEKVSIILDRESDRFRKFISDISGQDVKSHDNDPQKLIKCIRDVLHSISKDEIEEAIPGPKVIFANYNAFKLIQPDLMKQRGLEPDDISYADKLQLVERWLKFMLYDKLDAYYLLIKGGSFVYSLTGKPEVVSDLFMAKYPVTNRLYRQFISYLSGNGSFSSVFAPEIFRKKLLAHAKTLNKTGFNDYLQGDPYWSERLCSAYEDDNRFNTSDQPVVGVSWFGAQAYCCWLSCLETEGRNPGLYRLPTDVEWEYAASGKERRSYPWGTLVPTSHRANFRSRKEATAPVGSYSEGATPEGLYDMAGNVWEWMGNCNTQEQEKFFVRGGSWETSPDYLRCTVSKFQRPFYRSSDIGFRVVRSA